MVVGLVAVSWTGSAHAYRLLAIDETGALGCVMAPDCESAGGCPPPLECALGPDPDGRMGCFPVGARSTEFVYCCGEAGETCPVNEALGTEGTCTPVTTSDGDTFAICVYRNVQTFCAEPLTTPDPVVLDDCVDDRSGTRPQLVRYAEGNCDDDGAINKLDPCPCDHDDLCVSDAGAPDEDAGPGADGGNLGEDAGPPAAFDAGPPAGTGTPPLRFHGAGGCACDVTGSARPSSAPLAIGLVFAGLLLAIRAARRAVASPVIRTGSCRRGPRFRPSSGA